MRSSVIAGVAAAVLCGVIGCGGGSSDGAPASTATPTATSAPATNTPVMTATATATETPAASLAQIVARDTHGVALQLNQSVTAEGIATVDAGILANNKLKIFIQSDGAAVMVYHQTAGDVPAFLAGDDLRVTGVVRQQDPITDTAPLIGTVMIDVTNGSWSVQSSGNPLPTPQAVTLQNLQTNGVAYVGTLVSVANVRKVSGTWPALGGKSSSVTISDDGGTTQLPLRFQKNTITTALVNELNAIGNGPFTLVGIAVQNEPTASSDLLGGFEIWVRGASDINPG